MKTKGTSIFRCLSGKIVMALVLATLIGSLDVRPAMAGHDDERWERGEHRDEDRDEYRRHDRGHRHRPRGYRYVEPVYIAPQPVYVAPPVYYAPRPEPGISIFLPTIHIR
jgi:hypothetical protein